MVSKLQSTKNGLLKMRLKILNYQIKEQKKNGVIFSFNGDGNKNMKTYIVNPPYKEWWITKSVSLKLTFPTIDLGIKNNPDDMFEPYKFNDIPKWIGFKLKCDTDVSFESYEYGRIWTFKILGLGIVLAKYIGYIHE
jgi:hypothetical protein